jgi:hypothetical protein
MRRNPPWVRGVEALTVIPTRSSEAAERRPVQMRGLWRAVEVPRTGRTLIAGGRRGLALGPTQVRLRLCSEPGLNACAMARHERRNCVIQSSSNAGAAVCRIEQATARGTSTAGRLQTGAASLLK